MLISCRDRWFGVLMLAALTAMVWSAGAAANSLSIDSMLSDESGDAYDAADDMSSPSYVAPGQPDDRLLQQQGLHSTSQTPPTGQADTVEDLINVPVTAESPLDGGDVGVNWDGEATTHHSGAGGLISDDLLIPLAIGGGSLVLAAVVVVGVLLVNRGKPRHA